MKNGRSASKARRPKNNFRTAFVGPGRDINQKRGAKKSFVINFAPFANTYKFAFRKSNISSLEPVARAAMANSQFRSRDSLLLFLYN